MRLQQNEELLQLIQNIKAALNTDENAEALVSVAKNAHKAELLVFKLYKIAQENEHSQILSQLIIEAVDND